MLMLVPQWDVVAELAEKNNLNRPHFAHLIVADDDLEAVLRSIKASGYERVSFSRLPRFSDHLALDPERGAEPAQQASTAVEGFGETGQ